MRAFLTTSILALAALAGPTATGLAAQSSVAVVYRLLQEQRMIITPAAGGDLVNAIVGGRLDGNDLIATSPNTQAAVRFTDDGSLLRVNPNSQVQIRTEGSGASLVKTLEVEFGELWARVSPQASERSFQIQTPAGVAAVKGTEFIVRVEADGTTTVITLEGLLDFFNGVGTVEIPVGFAASAASNAVAPSLQPASPEQLQQFQSLIEDPESRAGEETVTIEVPGVKDGRPITIVIQVPRSQLGTFLGGEE